MGLETARQKSMTLSRLATHVAEIPSWSNAILMADETRLHVTGSAGVDTA